MVKGTFIFIDINVICFFRRIPEIYDWQKIYMIRFKTRPMEKRREPWQFDIDVMKRRLDDHKPRYIPKCLRENPKKKKIGRWEKTYYPD
jgi:small subunit ribosomal protein S30